MAQKRLKVSETKSVPGPSTITVEKIRELESLALKSKKHANGILTLLDVLKPSGEQDPVLIVYASQSLNRIFMKNMEDGHLILVPSETEEKIGEKIAQFRTWIQSLFHKYITYITKLATTDDVVVQTASTCTIVSFVGMECKKGSKESFVEREDGLLSTALRCCLHTPNVSDVVIREVSSKYINPYHDTICSTLRIMARLLDEAAEHKKADVLLSNTTITVDGFSNNVLQLLLLINIPKPDAHMKYLSEVAPSSSKYCNSSTIKQLITDCWLKLLSLPFSADTFKNVLLHMHSHILPSVNSPLLLADFLTDSYNVGGLVSLLSLNGLFILINKHNLDYPSFYPKLYRLLTTDIFHSKYRARFYKLVSLFMTSTHLPQYMVAAFVKRLARLSLTAPPGGCVFICYFIFNLMLRHKSVQVLLHRSNTFGQHSFGEGGLGMHALIARHQEEPEDESDEEENDEENDEESEEENDEESEEENDGGLMLNKNKSGQEEDITELIGSDPFIMTEDDPSKCRANESSLWELKTLTNHYMKKVASLAKTFFSENPPKIALDGEQHIHHSYTSMFLKGLEMSKNQKHIQLQLDKPNKLFDNESMESRNFKW